MIMFPKMYASSKTYQLERLQGHETHLWAWQASDALASGPSGLIGSSAEDSRDVDGERLKVKVRRHFEGGRRWRWGKRKRRWEYLKQESIDGQVVVYVQDQWGAHNLSKTGVL